MEKAKAPALKIQASEHFWVKGLQRAFELSGLVPLYDHVSKNLRKIKRGEKKEFTIGRSTIIYSVDENNTIHLISGWVGNRQKKGLPCMK